jgi:hypothetical protein
MSELLRQSRAKATGWFGGVGLGMAWSARAFADVQEELLREMRPGTGIEPEPSDPWWLLSAFLVVLGVVMVAAGVGAVMALRMRQREERGDEDIQASALDALDRLEKLVALGEYDGTEFATELSAVVRSFLERSLRLAATRQTTPEFLQGLRSSGSLSEEHQRLLQEFLEQCDLAKFAGVSPNPQQISRLSGAARDLIQAVSRKNLGP